MPAAVAGVPLVSISAGFPSARMFHRWRPNGNVNRVDTRTRAEPPCQHRLRYSAISSAVCMVR
jgi:hypothetical protein